MSFAVFLPVLVALGIFFVPVWLLGRQDPSRLQNTLVSPRYTPPEAIRNSSIAYSLRLAAFAPVFVLGALGQFWAVALPAVCFGLGVYLVYVLRPRIFPFLEDALERDQSITVHAFIARLCGSDARVRMFAASLTLFVLVAVIAFEAFAVVGICRLLFANDSLARGIALALLLFGAVYGLPGGHPATMYTGQLQLGAIFLGLFGAAALLIYQHVSALTPLPPYASFAIAFIAVCCLAVLVYRRSRYIETGRIGPRSRAAGLLSKFGKVLNPVISVLVVLAVVLAGMEFVAGPPTATAAPVKWSLSLSAIAALVLLPLLYPLSDVGQWQRLAAIEKNREAYEGDTERWLKALQSLFRLSAIEIVLLWLFVAAIGAVAFAALMPDTGANVIAALVQEARSGDNPIATTALSLLLVALAGFVTSTIAASFSAGLCTLRYDILSPSKDVSSSVAARSFFLAVIIALIVVTEALPISFTDSRFLALVFALCSPVLPFAALILAPGRAGAPTALAVLAVGPLCAAGAVIAYAVTRDETWLWAAAPACVVLSFLVLGLSMSTAKS
jgi:hypothetical protein